MRKLTDKKLESILTEVSKISNPFNINDVCLYYDIPRGKEGRERLDLEYGISSHVISHFVMKSDKFKRAETRTNGGKALWERVENDMVRQENQEQPTD